MKNFKRIISFGLIFCMIFVLLAGCTTPADAPKDDPVVKEETPKDDGTKEPEVEEANLTATEKILKEAETMSMEELAKKAIEESNGKTFFGVGNSSRGKTAIPLFIDHLNQ